MKDKKTERLSARVTRTDKDYLQNCGYSLSEIIEFHKANHENKHVKIRTEIAKLNEEKKGLNNRLIIINHRLDELKEEIGFKGDIEELGQYIDDKKLKNSLNYLFKEYERQNENGKLTYEDFKIFNPKLLEAEACNLGMDIADLVLELDHKYQTSKQSKLTF